MHIVTLSAAKGLSRWAQRCFAALSMTGPVLVVKVHYRPPMGFPIPSMNFLKIIIGPRWDIRYNHSNWWRPGEMSVIFIVLHP